jgi:hypothetical protein
MKKEYLLVLIAGLFILTYVLDAITNPLGSDLTLTSPYQFFNPATFSSYPFTTASIILKALALSLIPPLVLSLVTGKYLAKALIVLVLAILLELYTIQDLAAGTQILPLEWDLAFSLAGFFLLPTVALSTFKAVFTTLLGEPPLPHRSRSDSDATADSPKSFDL